MTNRCGDCEHADIKMTQCLHPKNKKWDEQLEAATPVLIEIARTDDSNVCGPTGKLWEAEQDWKPSG